MDSFTINADLITDSPPSPPSPISISPPTPPSPSAPSPPQEPNAYSYVEQFKNFFEPHFDPASSDMQAYPAGGDFPMTYTSDTAYDSSPSPTRIPSASYIPEQNDISAFDHEQESDQLSSSPIHTSHTQLPSGPSSVRSTDSLLGDDSDGSQHEQTARELRVPRKIVPHPIDPILNRRSVLVIGREFDQPNQIAYTLERRFGDIFHEHGVFIDSLPVPSHRLLSADPSRLLKRVYSCLLLCYNATEARLLVTSEGGYYSSLVPYALNTLGNNKVMLAFTHCQTRDDNLLAEELQNRILSQPHMQPMMSQFRSIFSWSEAPSDAHIQRMFEIINESPVYIASKKSCAIL